MYACVSLVLFIVPPGNFCHEKFSSISLSKKPSAKDFLPCLQINL